LEQGGRGLLAALDLRREIATEIATAALAQGLLLNAPRPDTLRFMPALNVDFAEIDGMISILKEVSSTVCRQRQ
jgi:acetylornithine/N-succinyldiaminopimelate aminotransferase